MVKVTVPATSANIGSGFDSSGIALGLYNTVFMDRADGIDIRSLDDTVIPEDAGNLVYRAAKNLFDAAGQPLGGLMLRQINRIPFTRGLGSSSACVVAGLLGANALLNDRYDRRTLMAMAAGMEGHPDNVIPAFSGGFSASVLGEGEVVTARFDLSAALDFVAFIPPFEMKTSDARGVIPAMVSHKDAVFNLSRSALLTAAFAARDYRLLKEAVKDRLHQPYRLGMIPGGERIFRISDALGALATYISGAGSTIMAIVDAADSVYREEIGGRLGENADTACYQVRWLKADNRGAAVETVNGVG